MQLLVRNLKKLPKLDTVFNELVIELETFCKNATNGCSDVFKTWVLGLSRAVSVPQPTAAAFRYAVKKAIHQRQQLLKFKSHAPILRKFLQQPFQMPGATSCCSDVHLPTSNAKEPRITDLLDKLNEDKKLLSSKLHYVQRREMRKAQQLARKQKEIQDLRRQLKTTRRHHEIKKLNDKVAYYKKKLLKTMVALSKQGPCADDTAELNIKLAQLQQENSELQSMNALLYEAIEDLQRKIESNQVITYKDGRYTDKLRV